MRLPGLPSLACRARGCNCWIANPCHTFPLEDFAKGLDTFVNRRDGVIKVVIEPNGAEG